VHGFSGFGSSLIYIPLAAAVYGSRIAAVTLLPFETAGATPFAIRLLAVLVARGPADLRRRNDRGAVRHLGADRAQSDAAALVHVAPGAVVARRADVGLALSGPADGQQ
jgi:hypothetical protein